MKAPNRVYMRMQMPPLGLMELGFDGKTAWSNSAGTGPVLHDEVPKPLSDMANVFAAALTGARISYLGRRTIGDRDMDAVRAEFRDRLVATVYFDAKTGLMAGMDPEGGQPAPEGRMTVSFDDYQRYGAILQSARVTTLVLGQEMVVRTLSVSHAPIDDKVFEMPAAVREVRDRSSPR